MVPLASSTGRARGRVDQETCAVASGYDRTARSAAKGWRGAPFGAIMRAVMPPVATHALAAALIAAALLSAPNATAKAAAQSPYSLKQTFGTTLRLLRVDLGLEVTEKDEEAAYLLFRYRADNDPKRVVEGAVELVALEHDVRVVVRIPALPEAHERLLRDKLVKKLREDYGEPPRRKPVTKPSTPDKPADPPTPGEPERPTPPTDGGHKSSLQSRSLLEQRQLHMEVRRG